jgi:hypothetical protein
MGREAAGLLAYYPMSASGKIQKYKLRETAVERYGLKGTTVE